MLAFVDSIIAGLAFNMMISFIQALFFTENLFQKQLEFAEEPKIGRFHLKTQNTAEAMLEALEECFRTISSTYLTRRKAEAILVNLKDMFWRMRVVPGQVKIFRTWEPIVVSGIISSFSLKLDSKFEESL